jgi:hypothetical protein
MIKYAAIAIVAFLCSVSVYSETHLSGDIKSEVLDSTGNPYIVDQDIVVPAGKKLKIKEGCVFLFKGFTGLNVNGQLNAAGTAKRPVVFTSVNDADYNHKSDQQPNPFDWNGILVSRESGGALFDNIQLRYSVYGIKSQNTNVSIHIGMFRQNGQFHFTVNDKIQYVQDNISYSYTGVAGSPESPASGDLSAAAGNSPEAKKAKTNNNTLIFRYSSLGVGVVGVVVGTIFLAQLIPITNDLNMPKEEFSKKYPLYTDKKWVDLKKASEGPSWGTGLGYGFGALGLICFGISFAF